MVFLELAAQAVRGFSPSVRAALKPGYVALRSPTELPAPLAGLILALAYPDGRGGDAAFLAPGAKSGRAGLSIQGNDGSVWRLVRDLGGAGGLHKLNRATNQFEAVSQDAQEMSQALRQGAGFVARTTWEQLFTLTGPQLPSRRPRPAKATASAPAEKPRVMPTNAWVDLDQSPAPADPSARLAELEQELKLARSVAECQFKLDGVNGDLFDIESKVKAFEELEARLAATRADLAAAPTPASIGAADDIVDRVRRFDEDKRRHHLALQKLYEERDQQVPDGAAEVEPLVRNQPFLASAGAALALLIAGAALDGGLRLLSLLAIVPASAAAIFALRWVDELQQVGRERSRRELFAQREKRLTDDFALTSSVVGAALKKAGDLTPDDFLAAMSRREALAPVVAQLEQDLARYHEDPDFERLRGRYAELKAEQQRLNDQLLSMSGGYVRDARDVEREIASLRAPPPAAAPKPAREEFSAVPTGPEETFEDPTPGLLVLATDLFSTDVPTLWAVLRDRVVQYLAALTDRRYHGVEVSSDGHAKLLAPGREVKAGELPAKDLDLYFLALRLTLIEKSAAQARQPVVVEDTFGAVLEADKQPLFGRMVKHLGSLTQVLHVSGAGQNAAVADTPAAI